ncbi:hypothetical protein WDU94_009666, partial [Cyamophila willieti]
SGEDWEKGRDEKSSSENSGSRGDEEIRRSRNRRDDPRRHTLSGEHSQFASQQMLRSAEFEVSTTFLSHLRDIRDRSVLRLFEATDVTGGTLGATLSIQQPTWDQDQSYFSEPEFDSEFQHQHIHKTKVGKHNFQYFSHLKPVSG